MAMRLPAGYGSGPTGRSPESSTYTIEFAMDVHRPAASIEQTRGFVIPAISTDRFLVRSLLRYDGTRSFTLMFTNRESPFAEAGPPPDVPHILAHGDRDDDLRAIYLPLDWCGLRSRVRSRARLAEMLQNSTRTQFEPPTRIDGEDCPTLLVLQEKDVTVRVVCDPLHGYLPRRIELVSPSDTTKIVERFDTIGYEQFGDDKIWFPVHGTLRTFLNTEWEFWLDDIRINTEIPETQFSIDELGLPPGVQVRVGGQPDHYTSNREDLFQERLRELDSHDVRCEQEMGRFGRFGRTPIAEAVRVEPTAEGRGLWPWFLAGGLLLLLAGGLALRRSRADL